MTTDDAKGLKGLIPCRCHEAYKDRNLTDPDCPWHNFGEDAADLMAQKDLELQSLQKQLSAAMQQLGERAKRIGELEADIKKLETGGAKFRDEAERWGAHRMLKVCKDFDVNRPEVIWSMWEARRK